MADILEHVIRFVVESVGDALNDWHEKRKRRHNKKE